MYYQCDLLTSSQVNSGDPEPAERLRKSTKSVLLHSHEQRRAKHKLSLLAVLSLSKTLQRWIYLETLRGGTQDLEAEDLAEEKK